MYQGKVSLIFLIICMIAVNCLCVTATEYDKNIQSIVLEDFELQDDGTPKRFWAVIPNRFGRKGSTDSGESYQKLSWIKAWPEEYFGKEIPETGRGEFVYAPDKNDTTAVQRYTDVSATSLGVFMQFERQGYNFVELYPLEQQNGKYVKSPLQFKGEVEQIDLWIWGANYNYFMEMVLMDYRGVEHRLDLGSIRHIGWKNVIVKIPNNIPQAVSYIPSGKVLSLVKLVVWTYPREKVSGAYLYIDHIKYLANVREDLYDGYQLGDPDYIKEVWDNGVQSPSDTDVLP
ncbi:MAG: flagellar filament outer layer protein FlaA [Spirochaetes bacterium]|nr:flagellar filament outer layer protein FlaA [Spirochaetota bacterium]